MKLLFKYNSKALRKLIKMSAKINPALDKAAEKAARIFQEESQDIVYLGHPKHLNIGTGALWRSIQGTVRRSGNKRKIVLGSNLIYAATHEYGDPDRKIPARPYLRPAIEAKLNMAVETMRHTIIKEITEEL